MNDWQRLDELLERGLDFYGRQLVSEAVQCWREVLYLSPGHQLALEYLEAAGINPDSEYQQEPPKKVRSSASIPIAAAPEPAADEPPLTLESLSVLAVELIRERRLEEALALLYTAHGEAPKDQSISRSINVIKQRLTREYRAEIGDLGQIPHLTVDDALLDELDLSEDELEVLRLVDGIVALDDIIQTSGFAALQIYRVVAQLLRRNLIVLKAPATEPAKPAATAEGPRTKTAPFRPTLVPPSPPAANAAPATTGPKLVALPPLPDLPPPPAAAAPSKPVPSAAPTSAMSFSPSGAIAAPTAAAIAASVPTGSSSVSATPAQVPAPPPAPPKPVQPASLLSGIAATAAANAAAAASAAAAAASAAPSAALDGPGTGPMSGEAAPRRPSPYAAHVAEAVRAHLQGKIARARELLALCVQECPDDPAAKRNLQRLKERLGVKEDR